MDWNPSQKANNDSASQELTTINCTLIHGLACWAHTQMAILLLARIFLLSVIANTSQTVTNIIISANLLP